MYLTITAQRLSDGYSKSSALFVTYLEKENQNPEKGGQEYFFNQYKDEIQAESVIKEIDSNTANLKTTEPRYYSIMVSPSKYELARLENNSENLKTYTRELMKEYAANFKREIHGKAVNVNDIKYFAKIEHSRTYKGTDLKVKENQPFTSKINKLKTELRKIEGGKLQGNIIEIKKEITLLELVCPHKQNGNRIVQGMKKEGNQSHIHIIVSRKDNSNSFSLSPGSKYKYSEVILNGKLVKRGFDRDAFYQRAEKTFDSSFGYKRNYVDSYEARKLFIKEPIRYFRSIISLPKGEKAKAFELLREREIPNLNVSKNQIQLALKSIKFLKSKVQQAMRTGSIEI